MSSFSTRGVDFMADVSLSSRLLLLSEEKGRIGLYVVKGDKALFRTFSIGSYYDQRVEILSGLEEGELVITNPAGLRSGDSVTMIQKVQR